ncbi:MAG: enoyl-CoA hydratase/isomerase family protein [Mesorhizobium sp.]
MTSTPHLEVALSDGWLDARLARPDQANALSDELVGSLLAALDLADAERVRMMTISGIGRHFCAGFDFSDIDQVSDGDLLLRFVRIETVLQRIYHAPFLTVGLAHGVAIGAGADIFAACKMRIAAPGLRMRMPGWQFGLALGTRRLVARVGETEALSMLLDSSWRMDTHALASGLITEIVEQADWNTVIERERQRTQTLSAEANARLGRTVQPRDSRAADMATLVESASRPGLRDRVIAYKAAAAMAARPKASA